MEDTIKNFELIINEAKSIFLSKLKDYGSAWRVLRPISIADQIYIKAMRIRNIQDLKVQKIEESVRSEFLGVINYAIIGLIQWELNKPKVEELTLNQALSFYDKYTDICISTMQKKNHDYGEAWKSMASESLIDMILVKIVRIKQIISLDFKIDTTENVDANLIDIFNYAIFSLILNNKTL